MRQKIREIPSKKPAEPELPASPLSHPEKPFPGDDNIPEINPLNPPPVEEKAPPVSKT